MDGVAGFELPHISNWMSQEEHHGTLADCGRICTCCCVLIGAVGSGSVRTRCQVVIGLFVSCSTCVFDGWGPGSDLWHGTHPALLDGRCILYGFSSSCQAEPIQLF